MSGEETKVDLVERLLRMGVQLPELEALYTERALHLAGTIVDAAEMMGVTRSAVKRRIQRHEIPWPPRRP